MGFVALSLKSIVNFVFIYLIIKKKQFILHKLTATMQVAASYHHRIIIVVIEVFDDSFLDENSKKIAGKSYPK